MIQLAVGLSRAQLSEHQTVVTGKIGCGYLQT
jgi:hypothetical protein